MLECLLIIAKLYKLILLQFPDQKRSKIPIPRIAIVIIEAELPYFCISKSAIFTKQLIRYLLIMTTQKL